MLSSNRFEAESYCIYMGTLKDLNRLGIPIRHSDLSIYECLACDRTLSQISILDC